MQTNLRENLTISAFMTRSQQSLFLCLFTLCFSVLCQLTVFRACVDVSCHKTRKHRHTRKLSGKLSTAEQHNLRKAFAERFSVSLWKLTVNANWPKLHSIWNKRDGKWGATKQAECTFLGKAAFMKTKIGSHLFIHNRYSDWTFCHPGVLLEPYNAQGRSVTSF